MTKINKAIKNKKPQVITQKTEKNRLKGLEKVNSRDLIKDLNKEYETARLRKLDKNQRKASLDKLYKACEGRLVFLCTKRSSAKVIQCLLKYGDKTVLISIFNEIKNEILNILCRSFGRFVIEKMFFYEPCYKIIKENIKFVVCDRIGIEFADWAYKKDRKIIEGFWQKEMELISNNLESLSMTSVKEAGRKLLKKGMVRYEIAHDIIYLHYALTRKENNKYFKNYDVKEILDKEIFKIDDLKIDLSNEEKEILGDLVENFSDLCYSKNGVLLAIDILNFHKLEAENLFDNIEPFFLKMVNNKFGVNIILHFIKNSDIVKIGEIIGINFEEMFNSEYSILPLVEIIKKNNLVLSKENEIFILEKFTDLIRNPGYELLVLLTEKNIEFKDKARNLLKNYKENKILADSFALEFFKKTEEKELIDVKEIVGYEYTKLFY